MVPGSYCSLKDLLVDTENMSFKDKNVQLFDMYSGG